MTSDRGDGRSGQLPRREAGIVPPQAPPEVQFVTIAPNPAAETAPRTPGSRERPGVPRGRGMRPVAPIDEPIDRLHDQHSYWSTDALFAESRRVEEELDELVEHRTDAELLVELALEPGASAIDVAKAQRRLALLHHPDRWATYASSIMEHHEDRMRRVNQVVAELRKRGMA